jgi:hypothetical protein
MTSRTTTLPVDSAARKEFAVGRGCLAYFPAAIAAVSRHSFIAGAKHTHGELCHLRGVSADHEDCIERHLMDLRDMRAARDRSNDPVEKEVYTERILSEAAALGWRALAVGQLLQEELGGAPLAPAARL